MKRLSIWLGCILLLLLTGCNQIPNPTPTPTPTLAPTSTLNPVIASTTKTPDPNAAARAYLEAWKAEDYPSMYSLLTSVSQEAISEEDFILKYAHVANEAALRPEGINYELQSSLVKSPYSAQVGYKVKLQSVCVGEIQRDTLMNLTLEDGQWRVQWDDALILPELSGGNHLSMEYKIPSRANIYDRNEHALVKQSDAVAIGLNTGEIDPEQENALISELWRLTGLQPDKLRADIDNYRQNDWYLPVSDVSVEALGGRLGVLGSF